MERIAKFDIRQSTFGICHACYGYFSLARFTPLTRGSIFYYACIKVDNLVKSQNYQILIL